MYRSILALALLAGSPAVEPQALSSASETAAPPGEDFADAALGLRFPAPGPEWFREAPGGAPEVVAVWVRRKGEETLGLVSISVDTAPKPAGVVDYAKSSFAVLSRPPLSFAIAKKGSLQIGGHEAFEVRFGPADATKRYVQDYVSAKKGAILVFTLQASKTCSPHGEISPMPAIVKAEAETAARRRGCETSGARPGQGVVISEKPYLKPSFGSDHPAATRSAA